jgi:hypothetical protein
MNILLYLTTLSVSTLSDVDDKVINDHETFYELTAVGNEVLGEYLPH